jgi:hypothetical protein
MIEWMRLFARVCVLFEKEIKMNTQIDKNRKTKSIIIFLGMFFILAGGGLLAGNRFGNDVVGPTIMFEFALCFSVIAAWSRKNQWAMLPAGLFTTIGLVTTLEILIPQSEVTGNTFHLDVLYPKMEIPISLAQVTGPVFMFLLAATFLVFASLSKKNWWAIIPGGIFASIGLVAALDILVPHEEYPSLPGMLTWGFYTWALFLGLAATFGVLWLLRKTLPTRWAIYPAAGFLAMAVLFITEGAQFQEYWLVTMLLVIGGTLLLAVLGRKRITASQQAPKIKA